MTNVPDLFTSTTASLYDTMGSHNGQVGFSVPPYQRAYNWSQENLKRLLEDCLNGFYHLSRRDVNESFTFLGTIILVNEQQAESTFGGTSLSIVDGQQRITTLSLLCCVLVEEISSATKDMEVLDRQTGAWLDQEIDSVLETLFTCTSGYLRRRGSSTPFPRLIRAREDARALDHPDYQSGIARFLSDFAQSYVARASSYVPPDVSVQRHSRKVKENYRYIQEQVRSHVAISKLNYDVAKLRDGGIDADIIDKSSFRAGGLRDLFEKLNYFSDGRDADRALSAVAKQEQTEGLVRLILFSWYLLDCVVLTRVETREERYAFDIFDALNTTGEPLTALETLKPPVMQWEESCGRGYAGSESEDQFGIIEDYLTEQYPDAEKRQRATKDLLVSFALYRDGEKLGLGLGTQRRYLRLGFEDATRKGPGDARAYLKGVADVAKYRRSYWEANGIRNLDSSHGDLLKLCLKFIADMRTSLAVPILARYWIEYGPESEEQTFLAAAKAITAFLVIRRSVTGGTRGIDSDFRGVMEKLSVESGDPILSIEELQAELRSFLAVSQIGVTDKDSWVKRARKIPLATFSRPLCRFLLFAASHNAKPSAGEPGLMTREGVIRSDELDFLNFRIWESGQYATVEHVAPVSSQGGDWEGKIYEDPDVRYMVGNLVLLPSRENNVLGNAPWAKKKIFYSALMARERPEREQQIALAEAQRFFTRRVRKLLDSQGCLYMLDPLAEVDYWREGVIQSRTRNTLELAWDEISPWLYGFRPS